MKNILLITLLLLGISLTAQKGWISLFNGTDLSKWHTFKKSDISGWVIENGVLTTDGKGGDLVTNDEYTDFILEFDFKIEPKGTT